MAIGPSRRNDRVPRTRPNAALVSGAQDVRAIRKRTFFNGYPIVPLLTGEKKTYEAAWTESARSQTADDVTKVNATHMNTGILCDGLRAVDIDLDDPVIAEKAKSLAVKLLGPAPVRTRKNSSRVLMLYRAATGSPHKRQQDGEQSAIEVLGHGQQFVAFGTHPSGIDYEWSNGSPQTQSRNQLTAVTEQQITQFLAACVSLVGSSPVPQAHGADKPQPIVNPHRLPYLRKVAGTMIRARMSSEAIEAALVAENESRCSPPHNEAKVRQLAADLVERYSDVEDTESVPAAKGGLELVGLGDLLSRPKAPVDYVWAGRIAAGTISMLTGKPKDGKSTLARNLTLAVARGESFLGWQTKQGNVLYLALEERREDVVADFRAMGANGTDDILIAEAGTVQLVVDVIREKKPVLVVIDPLFRLVNVRDEKNYAEGYSALGPLIDVARETGTHILCLHHSSKTAKVDAIDSPIGSTALGGAVSTLLHMKRTESYRTLQTRQRIGTDLQEVILNFDTPNRLLSIGGSRADAMVQDVESQILASLETSALTEPEINRLVLGRNEHKRTALRDLLKQRKIVRSRSGTRGDPFRYRNAHFLVPEPIEKIGDRKAFRCVDGETKLVPNIHSKNRDKSTRNRR